jgi:hypothetical protein
MTMTLADVRVTVVARPRAAVVSSPSPTRRHLDAETSVPDIVDVWGHDSFPASDPPANW